jgi:hypothetical protein
MVPHAEKYAAKLPELEWLYIGQLKFSFESNDAGRRGPILLSEWRNTHNFNVLPDMFGIPDARLRMYCDDGF